MTPMTPMTRPYVVRSYGVIGEKFNYDTPMTRPRELVTELS
jgi:hypothetical protein